MLPYNFLTQAMDAPNCPTIRKQQYQIATLTGTHQKTTPTTYRSNASTRQSSASAMGPRRQDHDQLGIPTTTTRTISPQQPTETLNTRHFSQPAGTAGIKPSTQRTNQKMLVKIDFKLLSRWARLIDALWRTSTYLRWISIQSCCAGWERVKISSMGDWKGNCSRAGRLEASSKIA